ncbi:NHL repeat containing protein [Thermincola ferriacetica]|uniref:NHL repeat containing protein n=1 Tax=Thermincola ferriacetica TaxID=281456 RepID=A0A0L6W158_9FIRM|nr:6-bladed beta-propeller [Thermincola ferriacetica]KNZ69206.1 NHL repeat containing protein [Thermincola ferriacetica]
MKKKRLANVTAAVLTVTLALITYIYFNIPDLGGGGVVSANPKRVGNIEFLFAVYGPGKGLLPAFNKPMSVATDKDNNIYVADSGNNRVVVFNRRGEFMFEFGERGVAHPAPGYKATWSPGKFNYPYGIDIDEETGNIFVADLANQRIQVFDSRGKFIDWFPKGPYGGTATDIFPLALDVKDGKVYIANPFQVVIFTTRGKFVKDFGMPGKEEGQFDRPNGIAVGDDGTIYVSDSNNLRVQALDQNGKVKWVYGQPVDAWDNFNKKPQQFELPRNIAVGPDGNIYVIDAFDFNIKVLSPQGKLLAEMGQRGVDDGTFNFPNGIAITKDKVIYVADKENDRVQAIRLTDFVIENHEE